MIASLFAILLASAQPAPAEEPVVTEAEVQADVAVAAEVPAVEADAAAEADATASAEAAVEAAPAAPEEEVICRRRLVPNEGIGRRHRVVRDCRPASEWPSSRRR